MKGWAALTLVVLAVAFLGGKGAAGTDVAKLRPVEVLWVQVVDGEVHLHTDMGDAGRGTDVNAAIEDLKQRASGKVFLKTAEYLLLSEQAQPLLQELLGHLRPSCMVCLAQGDVDLEQVGAYLREHPPKRNLARYQAGERELEVLKVTEGSMELVS